MIGTERCSKVYPMGHDSTVVSVMKGKYQFKI